MLRKRSMASSIRDFRNAVAEIGAGAVDAELFQITTASAPAPL
jgi:hypothetical protein